MISLKLNLNQGSRCGPMCDLDIARRGALKVVR